MKAADARRQDPLEPRKRLRLQDNYDARCLLAERLLRTHDAPLQDPPLHETRAAIASNLSSLEATLATLHDLQRYTACLVDLQMLWVDCSARVDALDADAAVRVWNRLDRVLRRVSQQTDRSQQLKLLVADVPPLVDKARRLVTQPPRSPPPLVLSDGVCVRAPVTLPHQWLPRIVLDICASVEREHAAGRCRPALVDATRKILSVVRDHNPYAFLSVLYRPPPCTTDWTLYATPQTDGIARLLHADFDKMREFAWWMEKPDTSFWKSFARLMRCVRRVGMAFHRVMIHLYAAAMQRQDPYVTANDVAFEIDTAHAAHVAGTLQSDGYGLARSLGTATDAIFHETYAMFPEVLVYVDQWRYEFSVYEHGFAPAERARDYEVGYHKWKTSKTWLEIAQQAKRVAHAWHRSRLGTRDFRSMTFLQLGRLETDIKHRLGKITDLLYKQNLAKWSQQRYQHSRARALMELKIIVKGVGHATSGAADATQDESTDNGNGHDTQKRFRPPTRRRHGGLAPRIKTESDPPSVHDVEAPIDEDGVRKWTDEEIDAHEQETERLYELQGTMLSMSDTLSLPKVLSTDEQDNALDDNAAVRGLLLGCQRLRATTRSIVTQGEDIALHGAAEALIQRPSLRLDDALVADADSSTPQDDQELTCDVEALETAIRQNAVRFLNLHQAVATDPDAHELAQSLALDALGLLRQAHDLAA